MADPEDRAVVLSPSKENALIGEEIQISVMTRDTGYEPVAGAEVRMMHEHSLRGCWITTLPNEKFQMQSECFSSAASSMIAVSSIAPVRRILAGDV